MTTYELTLETGVKSCSNFLESFVEKLNILLYHFLQYDSNWEQKLKLKTEELAFICDSLKTTPSCKVFIGTMLRQLFMHLWLIINKVKWQSMSHLVLSHCLKHDTVPVHLFKSKLYGCISGKLKDLIKIYYISDGAAL
jgi:hypothetical protein